MIRWFIFFLALPAVSAADTDVYANAAGCARLTGDVASDEVVIFRPGESITFWESTCPILDATMVGAGAIVHTVQCSGEGDTWEDYYMIETAPVDGFTLYPEDQPEARVDLAPCP